MVKKKQATKQSKTEQNLPLIRVAGILFLFAPMLSLFMSPYAVSDLLQSVGIVNVSQAYLILIFSSLFLGSLLNCFVDVKIGKEWPDGVIKWGFISLLIWLAVYYLSMFLY